MEDSITQLMNKDAASFDKATTFISAVSAIETAYGKLTKEAQNYVVNYNAFFYLIKLRQMFQSKLIH